MLHQIDGLILDMDGVLWRGSDPMPGLFNLFETIQQRQLRCVLATNNSTVTRDQYVEKLTGMGVQLRPDQVLTSSDVTAEYLSTVASPGTPVYVIGEVGLSDTLRSYGFRLTPAGAAFVIVGLDRRFTYKKMETAMSLILAGAQLIGTNADATLPTPSGPKPGAGALLSAIATATGTSPLILGKPEPPVFHHALAHLGTAPERTVMVGDRLDTDVLGGNRAGVKTVLVLSGVTSQADLAHSPIRPTWVLEDIRHLAAILESGTEIPGTP
jgi:4-nitrophenyl phosphatase